MSWLEIYNARKNRNRVSGERKTSNRTEEENPFNISIKNMENKEGMELEDVVKENQLNNKTKRVEDEKDTNKESLLFGNLDNRKDRWENINKNMSKVGKNRESKEEKFLGKEILIEFVLDGTYSFTMVFPKIFYVIENIIRTIRAEQTEYRGAVIKYGLTVFHNAAESKKFANGEYFTESEAEFIDAIKNIRFYGGSADGKEDLAGALDQAMRVLNNSGSKTAYRGVLMFSDSVPKKQDMVPDFYTVEQDGYINKGLRFAEFYTYTDEFTPKIRIVDRDGQLVENGRNGSSFGSLEDIISSDPDVIIGKIQKIVRDILHQTSITSY